MIPRPPKKLKITLTRKDSPLILPWWTMEIDREDGSEPQIYDVGDKVRLTGNDYENVPYWEIIAFETIDKRSSRRTRFLKPDPDFDVRIIVRHGENTIRLHPDELKHMHPLERLAAEAPENL